MICDIDDEWDSFVCNKEEMVENTNCSDSKEAPKASNIYISTKSMIAYLNTPIDLKIFWDLPVIPYQTPQNGIIKKQIKYNSQSIEELEMIKEKLQKESYFEEQIITSINNPDGRIKFKDIRKFSIGISKKDILSYRSKKKQAFYNCFVIIIRLKIGETFKEIHIKVFNTGKLEIPGIQSDSIFHLVLDTIIEYLSPHISTPLSYTKSSDTILINSNFNCGFYIERDKLTDILKYKYNIECFYDPCQYPGIQCKIKIDKKNNTIYTISNKCTDEPIIRTKKQLSSEIKSDKKNNEISFMIFRTGSILIVGKCNEDILYKIYEYLKEILIAEYQEINQQNIDTSLEKNKIKKIRKKIIKIEN